MSWWMMQAVGLVLVIGVGLGLAALTLREYFNKARSVNVVVIEIPQDQYDRLLQELVVEDAAQLLGIPGVYLQVADHYREQILRRWEEEQDEANSAPRRLAIEVSVRVDPEKVRQLPGALAYGTCPGCGGLLRPGVNVDGTIEAMVCQAPPCGLVWVDR